MATGPIPRMSTGARQRSRRSSLRRPRLSTVSRSLIQRVHNPRNRECGCDADCWCRRKAVGRAVKWWFPARLFGMHHQSEATAQWKRDQDSTG